MKKIFLIPIFTFLLMSCSNNNDSEVTTQPTTSFFNIENGNKWVYKRYSYNTNGGIINYQFSNVVDSVFVVGDTVINSNILKKIFRYSYNDNYLTELKKSYVRIDDNDHLVNSENLILHPGFDDDYQYVHDYYSEFDITLYMGTATYQNQGAFNEVVEGETYFIYNYQGDFIGNTSNSIPNNTINFKYAEQIGEVLQKCPFVSGNGGIEYRLVYYELN